MTVRNERFIKEERGSTRTDFDKRKSDKRPLVSDRLGSQRYLIVRKLRGFRTEEVSNQQPHGGDRTNELTQIRCGITESELRTVNPLAHHVCVYRTFL
ncbi:hypothetical protein TNCV_857391 [Trichonephila clavipes]|nr:hypothetical protein TNCV_857391 [Trichonephila clavipes]